MFDYEMLDLFDEKELYENAISNTKMLLECEDNLEAIVDLSESLEMYQGYLLSVVEEIRELQSAPQSPWIDLSDFVITLPK